MKVFRFAEVGSTNDIAFEKLSAGEVPPFAISAESQSKGRGRHGHTWISEKGNLFLSFALNPSDISKEGLGIFPQCFALLFVENLQASVQIKWPNDIFFNKRKVGGVLLETKFEKMQLKHVIFGVGVNVCSAPDVKNVAGYAAGVLPMSEDMNSVEKVENQLIATLTRALSLAREKKMSDFLQKNWPKYDIFYGQKIFIRSNGQEFCGIDVGVDANGALMIKDENGGLHYFNSGESEIIIDCW
ncbi:MAG: biotin--[acetyl-CoA-carboxylase] ligase [Opitutales bacterium]|nr:biotin--[acetyl-CoA-carboxylase] ligase [Opitutales bacterium]